MEVLLILLHVPYPVYEPSKSKCFQVGLLGWRLVDFSCKYGNLWEYFMSYY